MKSFISWLLNPIARDYTDNPGYLYKKIVTWLAVLTLGILAILWFYLKCNKVSGIITFLFVVGASLAGGAAFFLKKLLVDFPDRPSDLLIQHYDELLFSESGHQTGSLNDFYKEVSLSSIKIERIVKGLFRLPHLYTYYTNNSSGLNDKAYPQNGQGMAEDAIKVALERGIIFNKNLDVLDEGIIPKISSHP